MRYRALVSFTGTVSMAGGEVREISDLAIAKNLLKVGYIEEITEKVTEKETEKVTETVTEKVTEKKTRSPKRKENKDGN